MNTTYDTEDASYELELTYDYVPYTPARLTADPYYSEPEDGGYCEDVSYELVSYTKYEDGKVIANEVTPEIEKEFEKIFDDNFDHFHDLCVKDAESNYDEGSCYDDLYDCDY